MGFATAEPGKAGGIRYLLDLIYSTHGIRVIGIGKKNRIINRIKTD